MAFEPNKLLAEALKAAKATSKDGVIEHSELDAKYLDVLKKAGWVATVIRGWYLLAKPDSGPGTTTIWYAGFWPFIGSYLIKRFGKGGYCLSADSSIEVHTQQSYIGRQVTAITKKASNQTINLPHDTSLLLYSDSKNFPETTKVNGIYVMPLPLALCRISPSYFNSSPLNSEIALKMLPSVAELSRILLKGGLVTDAGRLAGAFRAIGEDQKADQIILDMKAVGLDVSESNPFEKHIPILKGVKIKSPYAGRIEAMWKMMRQTVIDTFGSVEVKRMSPSQIKNLLMDRYKQDAYHSLSIEGYEVTEELIQKIANGDWNPNSDPEATEQRNALAAQGYHKAFLLVLDSVMKAIDGSNPGEIFENDLQNWYRNLFSPSVQAGILNVSDLAGYRNGSVYVKGARHVPPGSKEGVLDSMEALFKLIKEEPNALVKAVLGHFIFVFIHPYMDGNGRIGRFILNLMLISGGYSWTIIRSEKRPEYMKALDAASSEGNIGPFAAFIKSELDFWTNKSITKS